MSNPFTKIELPSDLLPDTESLSAGDSILIEVTGVASDPGICDLATKVKALLETRYGLASHDVSVTVVPAGARPPRRYAEYSRVYFVDARGAMSRLETRKEYLGQFLSGKVEESGRLPDGSGFAVVSHELPKDHWLYRTTKDGRCGGPPARLRMGKDNPKRIEFSEYVRKAVQYGLRAATLCGRETDFDPDAVVQNTIVGLFGYHTDDGYSHDQADAEPVVDTGPLPGTDTVASSTPSVEEPSVPAPGERSDAAFKASMEAAAGKEPA